MINQFNKTVLTERKQADKKAESNIWEVLGQCNNINLHFQGRNPILPNQNDTRELINRVGYRLNLIDSSSYRFPFTLKKIKSNILISNIFILSPLLQNIELLLNTMNRNQPTI